MKLKLSKKRTSIRRIYVRKALSSNGRSSPSAARLHFGGQVVGCVVGRSGFQSRKREGDGATPRGSFRLLRLYVRNDKFGFWRSKLPKAHIRKSDGWCDEPGHGTYNKPVRLPFNRGHEKLWRNDRLYDVVVVLDYNLSRKINNLGSAIFFHIVSEAGAPTEGCVAVKPEIMRKLLAVLSMETRMIIS